MDGRDQVTESRSLPRRSPASSISLNRAVRPRILSQGDRRVVYAVLTQEGAELLARADPVSGPTLEDYFGRHFKTSEIPETRTLLDRVLDEVGGDLAESAKDGDPGSEAAAQGL